MKYADPSRCPGCRDLLAQGAARCPHCGLVVRHPLAQQVFATLTRADELLAQLRAESTVGAELHTPTPPPPPGARPQPARRPSATARASQWGLDSVPKVLLGLGALCLLVAAVIFLAVSWSWLGVGGRTVVLVVLTVASGAAAAVLLRPGLRIAAEALAAVSLGLAALDVAGAESAGWLGDLSGDGLLVVLGLVVAVLGSAFALLTHPHLGAPQVAAGLGALTAYAGLVGTTSHDLLAGHIVLLVAAGAIAAAYALDLRLQAWSLGVVAALVWSTTAVLALETVVGDPSLRGLWVTDGAGWSLLLSAAALTAPAAAGLRNEAAVWSGAGAALVVTVALTAPAADESARLFAVVALLATGPWVAAAALLPRAVRPVALAPATAGSLVLGGLVVLTAAVVAVRWGELGAPFASALDVRFVRPDALTEPLVAAPAVALLTLLISLLAAPGAPRTTVSRWLVLGAPATGVAALVTLASYDVLLAWVVGAGALLTLAALAAAHLAPGARTRAAHGVVALVLALVGCVVALPSATLTAAAAALALAVAASLHLAAADRRVAALTGVAVAPTLALALASGAAALEIDPAWVGVPVVVAMGLLAIARPRPEVEVPAALAAVAAGLASVPAASDVGGSLALHLTVAGVLVAASGLIHPTRRRATWAGSALLFLASWVRLGDLGVEAPEAYTLPLAVALVAVGGWRLHRDPGTGTTAALLPGLLLATVPSLLWALADPISVRALALGVGCVALAVGGAALRWSAPLLVGAAVGAVLVVAELAPYAATLPQWVWIGLAGTVLTLVGVTWERRLHELRAVAGHVGRLR